MLCGVGPEFRARGFLGRMFYILLYAGLQRQKYYFAWKLGINSTLNSVTVITYEV